MKYSIILPFGATNEDGEFSEYIYLYIIDQNQYYRWCGGNDFDQINKNDRNIINEFNKHLKNSIPERNMS